MIRSIGTGYEIGISLGRIRELFSHREGDPSTSRLIAICKCEQTENICEFIRVLKGAELRMLSSV